MSTKNILIVGVGGQGTLLTSRILGNLVQEAGYDVKLSEVHGMAQRGGSVVTHVRYGAKVYSPIIEPGQADVILAFEEMEAARWAHYLKEGGAMIVNVQEIDPMPVITGAAKYPTDIKEQLEQMCSNLIFINALEAAKEVGNVKVVNTVLLGQLAKNLDFDLATWENAIEKTVPPKFLELNKKAFSYCFTKC